MARDIAAKQEDWAGVLSAGRGLAAIRDDGEARRSSDLGRALAWKQGSWEGVLQAGRALESLQDFNEAKQSYEDARKLALQKGKEDLRRFERSVRFPTATLVQRLDLLGVAPGLARRWEIRDDATIEFALERDVRCFDGRIIDAKAVITAFEENRHRWTESGILAVEGVEVDRARIKTQKGSATQALLFFAQQSALIQCTP